MTRIPVKWNEVDNANLIPLGYHISVIFVLATDQNNQNKDGNTYNAKDGKSVDYCVDSLFCLLDVIVNGVQLFVTPIFIPDILYIHIHDQSVKGHPKEVA